jgi:hypothetical protein
MTDDAREAQNPEVGYWGTELRLAKARNRNWWKVAEKCVKLYEADSAADNNYNILFANTETLLPACYNQLPRPVVDRRYHDADPLAKAASQVLERSLTYLIGENDGEYEGFHSLVQQAVLGALVPGRGLTRFRYKPTMEYAAPISEAPEETEGAEQPEGKPEVSGDELFPDNTERVAGEHICGEDLEYDEVLFGYARRWAKVPWVAFYHAMTFEDLEANFGREMAVKIPLSKPTKRRDAEDDRGVAEKEEGNLGSTPVAEVWEIWHKGERKVKFFCPEYQEGLLKEVEDPLKLSGFYPIPKPLQFVIKVSTLTPTPLYKMYEAQARELNRITLRINRVLNALKVRGFYDGSIQGLKDLLLADDNTLIPAKDVAALQDGKNLQNSIWMMPLNELVVVLQQLMQGRENCKAVIYEITGISDIMRGSTQASETFGAQNLKSQWGTMRLQRSQAEVQRYVVDCLRIMGELVGEHFSEQTLAALTNLDFATDEQVQQAQQQLAMVQQMLVQMQQQPQAPAMPGQPPAALPPQVQQAAAQAQAILAKPKWSEVLGLLKSDALRDYRIGIESNSTINPKNAEQQKLMTEAMQALGSMYQAFGPVVQQGGMTLETLNSMVMAVTRRFEFGREVEDALARSPKQPQPQADQKAIEAQKQKLEQEAKQLEKTKQDVGKELQKVQSEKEKIAAQFDAREEKFQLSMEKANAELDMTIDRALMEIEKLLERHNMQVEGQLQGVAVQREADAKVEQRVGAERDKRDAKLQAQQKAQSDQKLSQAVQAIAVGGQSTQEMIAAMMEQLSQLKQPRKISVGRDADGNLTEVTSH